MLTVGDLLLVLMFADIFILPRCKIINQYELLIFYIFSGDINYMRILSFFLGITTDESVLFFLFHFLNYCFFTEVDTCNWNTTRCFHDLTSSVQFSTAGHKILCIEILTRCACVEVSWVSKQKKILLNYWHVCVCIFSIYPVIMKSNNVVWYTKNKLFRINVSSS